MIRYQYDSSFQNEFVHQTFSVLALFEGKKFEDSEATICCLEEDLCFFITKIAKDYFSAYIENASAPPTSYGVGIRIKGLILKKTDETCCNGRVNFDFLQTVKKSIIVYLNALCFSYRECSDEETKNILENLKEIPVIKRLNENKNPNENICFEVSGIKADTLLPIINYKRHLNLSLRSNGVKDYIIGSRDDCITFFMELKNRCEECSVIQIKNARNVVKDYQLT